MTGFQLLSENRNGCHVLGRKCSLVREHLSSLPFGEFMITPAHYIYMYIYIYIYNLLVLALCLRIIESGLSDCFGAGVYALLNSPINRQD